MTSPALQQPFWLVFSDLDGTLLDHHTYSPEGSMAAVRSLAEHGIPLIFCSSKTYAEQWDLQQQMGLEQPFIIENGSAVAIPKTYFSQHLEPTDWQTENHLIYSLAHAPFIEMPATSDFEVQGFRDVPDAVLAERTGLNGPALKRARDRWFTETLITPLSPEYAASIEAALKPHGWALSKGGRFYSVQSAQANKGEAMRWLGRQFEKNTGIMPKIAAIGDSPNDFPMLSAADKAFLVQRNDSSWAPVQLCHLVRVANIGPLGFSDAVRQIIPRSA